MDEDSSNEKNVNRRGSGPSLSAKLRTHFKIQRSLQPILTGSGSCLSPKKNFLLCDCSDNGIKIVEIATSRVVGVIRQPEETITCFCTLKSAEIDEHHFQVITASHNGLLRQWRVSVGDTDSQISIIRSWKAQPLTPAGRVCSLQTDKTESLLASGATDGSVRVWDLNRKTCTHLLRGHVGVVSLVRFWSDEDEKQLILLTSAVGDGQLRAWNLLSSSTPSFTLLNGHSSAVTDAIWTPDGQRLVTVSRDQLIVIWNTTDFTKLRTFPCFEQVECVLLYPHQIEVKKESEKSEEDNSGLRIVTAGSRGQLRMWDVDTCKCLCQSVAISGRDEAVTGSDPTSGIGFLSAAFINDTAVMCTTSDRRIVFYDMLPSDDKTIVFQETRQIPGDVGEVLDACMILKARSSADKAALGLLAVATNSNLVRVYNPTDWSCVFLAGHRAAVTSLSSVNRDGYSLLISGSRDNDVMIWLVDQGEDAENGLAVKLVARAAGHTAAVLTIAALRNGDFFVSAGVDLTIKIWTLPTLSKKKMLSSSPFPLSSVAAVKAHEKDINALALSPNGRFVASGSQDRTAKVWLIDNESNSLQLLGALHGHRRAIWSVDFSPIDQLLATSSADGSLKLWALSNLSCLRTFEGHDVAVLRCRFMTRGMQLVSGGADGVVKLWSLQTSECVATLADGHDDRVWAVTPISDGDWLATGSADDRLVLWQDYTSDYARECTQRDHARALDAQRLDNLLAGKNFVEAFHLALSLNQPARLWRIVRELRLASVCKPDDDGENKNQTTLPAIITGLNGSQLADLLRVIAAWNTNTRFVLEAQYMLHLVLQSRSVESLLDLVNNDAPETGQQLLRDAVEALLSYSQRHFARIDRLSTQSAFVDFAWSQLKLTEEGREVEIEEAMPLATAST